MCKRTAVLIAVNAIVKVMAGDTAITPHNDLKAPDKENVAVVAVSLACATEAVKLYDSYVTNLSVITGGSRESSNQLLGDLAEKSLNFKVDVSDLEGAAETILRTGKSIDETNKYLENTVYLSKLGFQDMDTSASQLVTIGNAYGNTAGEMAAVVDKNT